jgi:ATP-dependent helicase HrpB
VLQPDPQGRRRIVVLATNVAESSVTLPGVRVVIDAGLAREPRFDPNSGFSRLDVVPISQASADQRAGRAGRVAEGWCVSVVAAIATAGAGSDAPEIASDRTVRARAGTGRVGRCGPAFRRCAAARRAGRGARSCCSGSARSMRGRAITAFGRRMLGIGTHPRLAAMLLAPTQASERALACDLAALVEARDPLSQLAPR